MSEPTGLAAIVAENVLKIRKANRWTQDDLAKRCARLDRGMLSKIEHGNRGITVRDLEDLAQALSVKPWQLLKPLNVSVFVVEYEEPDVSSERVVLAEREHP